MKYIYPELAKHLKERADAKAKNYGTYLKSNNGRNGLIDCYQELLDAIVYLSQDMMDEYDRNGYKVSDAYWITEEPPPTDSDDRPIIEVTLDDLSIENYILFTSVDFTSMFNGDKAAKYVDLIRLTEWVRQEIERGKNMSEKGLSSIRGL